MILGCYSLHLYCDNPKCDRRHADNDDDIFHAIPYVWPEDYTGPNRAYCIREAKSKGWKIGKGKADPAAICPDCCKRFPKLEARDVHGGTIQGK